MTCHVLPSCHDNSDMGHLGKILLISYWSLVQFWAFCNLLPSFTCECHWMASGPLLCLAVLCLSIAIYSHQTTSNVHQSGRLQVDSWVAASEIRIRFMMVQIWCVQSGAWTRSSINIFPWYRMISGCVSNLDNMQRGKSCRDQGSAKTTLAVKRISAGHPRRWWHQPQMMLFPVERCRQAPQGMFSKCWERNLMKSQSQPDTIKTHH